MALASRGPALLVHDSRTGLSAQATHRRPVTCAAVSPTEPIAAAGDDVGRILLWYLQPAADAAADADDEGGGGDGGPSGALNVFPLRQMHWHAQRVGALSFSIDGAYLLSGGREAVLVSWQLHTAERSFVPRLAAPISAVAAAPDGGSVALLSHDNAVRLVDVAARRVRRTVHGLLLAARLAADGRLRCLLVYGGAAGGRVQWWAPRRHQQLLALEVAPTAPRARSPPSRRSATRSAGRTARRRSRAAQRSSTSPAPRCRPTAHTSRRSSLAPTPSSLRRSPSSSGRSPTAAGSSARASTARTLRRRRRSPSTRT